MPTPLDAKGDDCTGSRELRVATDEKPNDGKGCAVVAGCGLVVLIAGADPAESEENALATEDDATASEE